MQKSAEPLGNLYIGFRRSMVCVYLAILFQGTVALTTCEMYWLCINAFNRLQWQDWLIPLPNGIMMVLLQIQRIHITWRVKGNPCLYCHYIEYHGNTVNILREDVKVIFIYFARINYIFIVFLGTYYRTISNRFPCIIPWGNPINGK